MNCTQFVEYFSEYLDGTGPAEIVREAREHEGSCPSCARYRRVVEEGAALLRTLPCVDVREDFAPRLQHRLYHVDEDSALKRHVSSGTTALTALGMAVLLTVVAWSPTLRREPVVELDPIVVTHPARNVRPTNEFGGRLLLPSTASRPWRGGLWDDAHQLLYEYSPVQRRYREHSPVRQTGLDRNP